MARLSLDGSLPCLRLNTLSKCWMTRLSKSSPPRWVSPAVAMTSKTPLSMVRSDTSKVPPPRSKTRMFFSPRLLVEAVGDGGRGGLVDDAQHVEARDGARVLGRLALRVVEVGGHGDDRVLDLLAEVGLGGLLHLDEHHGRDLLGGEGLRLALDSTWMSGLPSLDDLERPELHVRAARRVRELAADEALGVEHGVGRVQRGLVLGGVADEALRVGEGDVRRGDAVALVVGDDLDLAVLVDTDCERARERRGVRRQHMVRPGKEPPGFGGPLFFRGVRGRGREGVPQE